MHFAISVQLYTLAYIILRTAAAWIKIIWLYVICDSTTSLSAKDKSRVATFITLDFRHANSSSSFVVKPVSQCQTCIRQNETGIKAPFNCMFLELSQQR